MAKPFMSKAAIHFEVPMTSPYDSAQYKTAQGLLAQQIIDYAKVLEKNPNAIIQDTVIIAKPEDYMTRADTPANAHLAELMSAKQATVTPKRATVKKEVVTRETEEEEERPHVVAMSAKDLAIQEEEEKAFAAAAKTTITVKTAAPAEATTPVDQVVDKIFEKFKRTSKSVTIITAFAKAGKEMSMDDLVKATKLSKNDISSWLNQTGKNVKAIERSGRGLYKLNPDKA